MPQKLIVFVVGPPNTGKTAICNHLAEISSSIVSADYHPTQGVRILEFERFLSPDVKKGMKWKECAVDVELWDCAGDPKFLDKFAAFTPRSSAVIYVANSELKPETDLDDYQQLFPSLNSNQSSVFVHRGGQASVKKPKFISKILSKSPVVYTSFDMDPEVLKMEFDKLLVNAYTNVLEQGEKEERAIAV